MTDSRVQSPSVATRHEKCNHRLKSLLSLTLITLALSYVIAMIFQHTEQLQTALARLSISGIIGFNLLATASISLSTLYHAIFLLRLNPGAATIIDICMAYAMGQIVRYLPGKVAGVVFEANYLRGRFELSTIALATLAQSATSYLWAGLFSAVFLTCSWLASPLPLLALLPALFLIWLIHARAWPERAISKLPWAGKYLRRQTGSQWHNTATARLTVLLAVNWLPIMLGFVLLLHHHMAIVDAITFAAAYIAAAVISSIIILVPSGIIVREALFVWIGGLVQLPVSELILMSGLLRLILTFSDLLNVALFLLVGTVHKRYSRMRP